MASNRPSTRIGNLHNVVGRGSNSSTQEWVLEQIHFHWGRTGKSDEGSEHYMLVCGVLCRPVLRDENTGKWGRRMKGSVGR